ncbi:hypothetical protein HPB49_017121 [Dermacentor silvarum]|uniref:Uncharacterized protein n=1 Tax=Dermacentor silvarum TaxID=543639 RepID=A0ACB8E0Y6_DERSI|nr:hypothetical protein HPB49_017121 [Dermacentor silvarum]
MHASARRATLTALVLSVLVLGVSSQESATRSYEGDLRDIAQVVIKKFFPIVSELVTSPELSVDCSSSLLKTFSGLRQHKAWAYRMEITNRAAPRALCAHHQPADSGFMTFYVSLSRAFKGIANHNQATDGWQLVLSRRQRKADTHNDKEKASNKNNINGGPSAGGAKGDGQNSETGIGRRNMRPARGKPLPPLPKNDIKIILKLHKGLMLKEYLKTEIPQAIIRSTGTIIPGSGPNQRKITGEDFILRILEGTNIIIVSTPSLEVANVIRRITCMELRDKQHPFNVYVADPDNSYKWVVHGFPAHTESADLQQHLRVRTQEVTIERARMLGSSNTALLTFSGGTRSKCVYYMGVEMRCTEYRPTVQMCLECMQEGHRSDVCPNPKNICRGCGLENPPPQGHECDVRCAVCRAAAHETRRCPNKLIAAKRGKTTRQSRSRERSNRGPKGTGALVRVYGGGGLLSTPIEI